MTKHRKILNLIAQIRNSHSTMEDIFLYGSCLNLFCILRAIYPEAKAYFNVAHIVTKIDGKFYDITGCVNGKGYLPYKSYYRKKRLSRSFSGMMKYENDQIVKKELAF